MLEVLAFDLLQPFNTILTNGMQLAAAELTEDHWAYTELGDAAKSKLSPLRDFIARCPS